MPHRLNIKRNIPVTIASILVTILFTGCGGGVKNTKVSVFHAGTQQVFPIVEVLTGQKSTYDTAYEKKKKYFIPESVVEGAVIAASMQNKEEIAGFFDRIQQQQHLKTVVLMKAVPPETNGEQAMMNSVKAKTAAFAYKTPYGILSPSSDLMTKIHENGSMAFDDARVKNEAWVTMMTPFIVKSFPDADFVPLLVNENATEGEKQELAGWLAQNLPEESLVIAETIPETSSNTTVAEFQLKFAKNVLENFDTQKFGTLPVKNASAIDVLSNYLALKKAQTMKTQFIDPATGNFISFSMSGPIVKSRSVFLVSFGDLMFDRAVRTLMDKYSLDYPFQKMDLGYLKNNDILVANLEGPIAKKRVVTGKSIAFRFKPDIAPLLQKYFFDAVSEANNHAVDMSWDGFNDTFELLAPTGIKVFGNPKMVEDRSVATFDVDGQKIAFIGLEEVVWKVDDAKAVAKVKELNEQGFKVIPFMHWGIEYQHRPNVRQQQLAHKLIDAGAIAVIGAHPHVVETYETYKNRPIFYSLGNAIFDQYFSRDTQEGLSIAMIVSSDQLEIYFLPITIDRSQFQLMDDESRKKFLEKFTAWGEYQTEAERQSILGGKLVLNL